MPFGGLYRIIDFTLSNCINSDLRRILVLTQYKARSLDRHIASGWSFLSRELDEYIEVLPPQQRIDENWYKGTADAIYQNIYTIEKADPKYVLILAGDHIYKMDYGDMIRSHLERKADLTVGCIPVPVRDGIALRRHAGRQRRPHHRLPGKADATRSRCPDDPSTCLASMGIYVFTARLMYELLCQDATRPDSDHDFGKNIIPGMIGTHKVFALPLPRQEPQGDAVLARRRHARRLLPGEHGPDRDRPGAEPLRPRLADPHAISRSCRRRSSSSRDDGPATAPAAARRTTAWSARAASSAAATCAAASCRPTSASTATPWSRTRSCSSGVDVGRHCRIRRAIIDKDVKIPPGTTIGYDLEHDRQPRLSRSPSRASSSSPRRSCPRRL